MIVSQRHSWLGKFPKDLFNLVLSQYLFSRTLSVASSSIFVVPGLFADCHLVFFMIDRLIVFEAIQSR